MPDVVAQAAVVLVCQSHQRDFENLCTADCRQKMRALFVELHTDVPRVLFVGRDKKPAISGNRWFRIGGIRSVVPDTDFLGGVAGKGWHLGGYLACGLALDWVEQVDSNKDLVCSLNRRVLRPGFKAVEGLLRHPSKPCDVAHVVYRLQPVGQVIY